jgi:AP-3 complex subunit sigma
MHRDDIEMICTSGINEPLIVKLASKARRNSFASANPLSLGSGAGGPRSGSLQTPLGWLTDRLAGVATR